MPELPEVEAWVRELSPLVARAPIASARPGHIATLKSFDPPPAALEGRTFAGSERRGKNLLFPTDDGELVLRVHLMSAGRLRYVAPGKKGPAKPMFRVAFADGGELVPDGGRQEEARGRLDALARRRSTPSSRTSARTRSTLDATSLGAILRRERRQLHSLLRDQRALAGIGRAHANEVPVEAAPAAVPALDRALGRGGRAARDRDPRRPRARARAAEQGKGDDAVYRVHGHYGEPCPRCGDTLRRVDFEEHTITYCATCQTGGTDAQGPASLPPAALTLRRDAGLAPCTVALMSDLPPRGATCRPPRRRSRSRSRASA